MEVKISEKSKSQKEIEVVLPLEKVNEYSERAAREISLGANINGFRPGKAPKQIIEEKFGKERVWQESCFLAVKDTCAQIIKDNDFLIVSSPQVEIQSMEPGKPVSYKAIINLMPSLDLPDYKKIAKEILKEKKEVKVSQEEIVKAIEAVQKLRAKAKIANRPSQKGDELLIDFQGSIDGLEHQGLKAEKMRVILGQGQLAKEFEEELVGLKEGEAKTFSLEMDFPAQGSEKMEKKKVDFSVKIHSVKERELPQINDEFAKSLGDFANLKDLQAKIKENIGLEKEVQEKEKVRAKIIEAIREKTPIDIPEVMVDKESEVMMQNLKARISQAGMSFEDYLKRAGKTEQEIRQKGKEVSEKRIATSLILEEIAKKEKIEAGSEEIEQEVNIYLSQYQGKKEDLPDPEKLKLYFKDVIKNEKVFQLLEKLGTSEVPKR